MSYDLIFDAHKLVEVCTTESPDQLVKILRSEFSKWNHPIRMKFLVGAAVEHHAHVFLNALLDVSKDKNALITGPLVFQQVYYLAEHYQFKQHAFDLAKKSLTLQPPKQLHQKCMTMADKGQWLWAGLLFPYIQDQKIISNVYLQLMGRMDECRFDPLLVDRFEGYSNNLYTLVTEDPKRDERWVFLMGENVLYYPIGTVIEAALNKQNIQKELEGMDHTISKRKM